jgi:hypothetical protein
VGEGRKPKARKAREKSEEEGEARRRRSMSAREEELVGEDVVRGGLRWALALVGCRRGADLAVD